MASRTTERRKLLVVANRAPVTYEDGVAKRGGGGLVTALAGLIAHHDVTWIASAMTDEDRAIAAERDGSFEETTRDGHTYRLRLVAHDPPAYDRFYNVVANPALWFVQHRMPLRALGAEFRDAWDEGYVPVNATFAAATLEELDREPEAAVLLPRLPPLPRAAARAERAAGRRQLALRPHPVAGAGRVVAAARRS